MLSIALYITEICQPMIYYPLTWLSVKRVANALRACCSYAMSVCGKSPKRMAYPYAASFEPANFCNLRCPQCPTGKWLIDKQPQKLSLDQFKCYIDALSPYLMYANLYFQGEPFLNKELPQMVTYAHKKKIFTCISTNGHFLTAPVVAALKQAGIDRLIVCVDGATQQSYQKYRVGGNLPTVLEGIKRCVQAKLPVEVQCLLLQSTENEQNTLTQMMHSMGVKKVVFKKAQFYDDYLVPNNMDNTRYVRLQDGTLVVKRALRNRCYRMWTSVVVDVNGNVLPCCYDKFGKHAYGNLNTQSFDAIWQGEKAVQFRKQLLLDRKAIAMCLNCTE